MPDKDARPNSYFRLSLGGAESAAAFSQFEGLGSETEVLKTWTTDAQGRPMQKSSSGRTIWKNVTLKRVADENLKLWEWHLQVAREGPANARKECTIEQLDYKGKAIATYKLTDAWPCKYTASAMNAGENTATVETIELAHDGCERV
jgi:phage tail-like protein